MEAHGCNAHLSRWYKTGTGIVWLSPALASDIDTRGVVEAGALASSGGADWHRVHPVRLPLLHLHQGSESTLPALYS
jgi:hypothetical protein